MGGTGGFIPISVCFPRRPIRQNLSCFFRQRVGNHSGAFFDYTARYGVMRKAEDRITLRDNLTTSGGSTSLLFETLADQMNLTSLLDLPLLSLSNGQTRRARIVKAIMDNPELLLFDEPLSNYLTYLRNRNIYPSWQLVLTLNHGNF